MTEDKTRIVKALLIAVTVILAACICNSSIGIKPKLVLDEIAIKGASFALPETLKDDVSSYRAAIPEEVLKSLPIPLPSEAIILATPENLSLILADRSDKGLATIEGGSCPKISSSLG